MFPKMNPARHGLIRYRKLHQPSTPEQEDYAISMKLSPAGSFQGRVLVYHVNNLHDQHTHGQWGKPAEMGQNSSRNAGRFRFCSGDVYQEIRERLNGVSRQADLLLIC